MAQRYESDTDYDGQRATSTPYHSAISDGGIRKSRGRKNPFKVPSDIDEERRPLRSSTPMSERSQRTYNATSVSGTDAVKESSLSAHESGTGIGDAPLQRQATPQGNRGDGDGDANDNNPAAVRAEDNLHPNRAWHHIVCCWYLTILTCGQSKGHPKTRRCGIVLFSFLVCLGIAGLLIAGIGVTAELIPWERMTHVYMPQDTTVQCDITKHTWLYQSATIYYQDDDSNGGNNILLAVRHGDDSKLHMKNVTILNKAITRNDDNNTVVRNWPLHVNGSIEYDHDYTTLHYMWSDNSVDNGADACSGHQSGYSSDCDNLACILGKSHSGNKIVTIQFCLKNINSPTNVSMQLNEQLIVSKPTSEFGKDRELSRLLHNQTVDFENIFTSFLYNTHLYITSIKQKNDTDYKGFGKIYIQYNRRVFVIEAFVIFFVIIVTLSIWMGTVCYCRREGCVQQLQYNYR